MEGSGSAPEGLTDRNLPATPPIRPSHPETLTAHGRDVLRFGITGRAHRHADLLIQGLRGFGLAVKELRHPFASSEFLCPILMIDLSLHLPVFSLIFRDENFIFL